jgi:ABC-type dipeptide/oligopeptide/nickel transport system permease component
VIAYLGKRLAWTLLVLLGISGIVFVVVHLSGDPAALYMGPEGTKEDYQLLRAALGFDRPLPEQYGLFLWRAAHGDFGRSLRHRQPTLPLVLARLPATLTLTAAAMILALLLALPLGLLSALRRRSILDAGGMVFALAGQCVPTFWLGILLILVFAVQLRWFPVYGGDGPTAIVLPAITLGVWAMARTARITRSSMLDVLREQFILAGRAKGLDEKVVVYKHALKNAIIPTLTVVGITFALLIGGAVVIETVFNIPGLGRLIISAVLRRDYPVIQGVVLLIAVTYTVVNLMVDLAYLAFDPRIRYR